MTVFAISDVPEALPCLASLTPSDPLWSPTIEGVLAVFEEKEPKDNPCTNREAATAWITGFIGSVIAIQKS